MRDGRVDAEASWETCARTVHVGQDAADDAAVVEHAPGAGLVLTADVIAPIVDDPFTFGQIAAANSLSDVWAMSGEPRFALNLMFFPDEQLPISVLSEILHGAAAVCRAAGVAIVGGHTVRDPELKFGLSVTGEVETCAAWANTRAAAGEHLILTKALGTGLVGQAIKQGLATADEMAAAIASMTSTNQRAMQIGRAFDVRCATDVTGFGLLGHLRNILRGSQLAARLWPDRVPHLPGAMRALAAGLVPGGSKANLRVLAETMHGDIDPATKQLMCDAQTSGGLLLCVAPVNVDACLAELAKSGHRAADLGELCVPSDELVAGHVAFA